MAFDDGPYYADEGASVQGAPNVLDNDKDPRNDPMFTELVNPPVHFSEFELLPDGTFIYVHDGSETATDSFSYTANDLDGVSNEAVVSILINALNDPPVITLQGPQTVVIDFRDDYIDAGAVASDEEDGDLTDKISIGGDNVNSNSIGTYVITYNVTDSSGSAANEVIRTIVVSKLRSGGSKGGGMLGLTDLLLLSFVSLLWAYVRRRIKHELKTI